MIFDPKSAGSTTVIQPPIDWPKLAEAKRWLRRGCDLYEAALKAGLNPRELDRMLWRTIGNDGFGR